MNKKEELKNRISLIAINKKVASTGSPVPFEGFLKEAVRSASKEMSMALYQLAKRIYQVKGPDTLGMPVGIALGDQGIQGDLGMVKSVNGGEVRVIFNIVVGSPFVGQSPSDFYKLVEGGMSGEHKHSEGTFIVIVTVHGATPLRGILQDRDKLMAVIASVMTHELTHSKDILSKTEEKTQDKMKQGKSSVQDFIEYVNGFSEFKSRLQEIQFFISTFFDKERIREKFERSNSKNDFVMGVLSEVPAWEELKYGEFLNEKNRKTALNSVYRFLDKQYEY